VILLKCLWISNRTKDWRLGEKKSRVEGRMIKTAESQHDYYFGQQNLCKVSCFYCNTHSPATFRYVKQPVTELAANLEKVMTQFMVEFCQLFDMCFILLHKQFVRLHILPNRLTPMLTKKTIQSVP